MAGVGQFNRSGSSDGASPWSTEPRVRGRDITLLNAGGSSAPRSYPADRSVGRGYSRHSRFGQTRSSSVVKATYGLCAVCIVLLLAIGRLLIS